MTDEDLQPARLPKPAKANRFDFATLSAAPDEAVKALRKELKERKKESVTSARAIVHLEGDPLKVLVRRGAGGKFGFVGGKVEAGETPQETVVKEVIQELDIRKIGKLRPLTDLKSPNRMTLFSRKKWEKLGFSSDGYEVVKEKDSAGKKDSGSSKSEKRKGKLLVPNRKTRYFTLEASENFMGKVVENREVQVLDLSDKATLGLFKKSEVELARLWRSHIIKGTPIPDEVHDRGK